MNRGNVIRFTAAGSANIQAQFTDARGTITIALNSVMRTIETINTWWKGNSAGEFIEACTTMRDGVQESLVDFMMEHKDFIARMERAYSMADNGLSFVIR